VLNPAATLPESAASQAFNQALPDYFTQLTEPQSRAMAEQIRYQPIQTSLAAAPIHTALVQSTQVQLAQIQAAQVKEAQVQTGDTPILLLHGFDSSLLEYRRLWPLLTQTHVAWSIDLLGFGFTERPQGFPFSATAIKTHLFDTWQQLIHQPVILLGASMGGAAALDFALTYPDLVKALILIDSVGVQPGPPGKLLIPPLGWLATEFLRSPQVRLKISRNAYHDANYATADAQACAASHLQVPGWRDSLIRFTQSGGYRSLEPQLPQLQPPTCILWGESDRILGTKDAGRLQRAIPDSKLIWISAAGHVPHLEAPERTAAEIEHWLAGI
jgi:pimeloyl-ACP methyl ester carboxylesterase